MALENRRHFFVYGEVSRAVEASSSSEAFTQSLKLCKNAIVKPEGGVTNRLGTQCIQAGNVMDGLSRGITNRARLAPLPSRLFSDSFCLFPNDFAPATGKLDADDIQTFDVKPSASGFGVDVVVGNVNTGNQVTGALDDYSLFGVVNFGVDDNGSLRLRYTNNENSLQFGFSTNNYVEITPSYSTINGERRVEGGFFDINDLRPFDPVKYGTTAFAISAPSRTLLTKTGSGSGGTPLIAVYTLFNEVTNEELVTDVQVITGTPRQFSPTEYYTATVDAALPEDHVMRVYLATGNTARSCRLLGVIRQSGSANGLVYTGQPLNEGISFPLNRQVLVGANATGITFTTNNKNFYYCVTHGFQDYPYSLLPTVAGLNFSAMAAAAEWSNQRLVLGGFGLNTLLSEPAFTYGTNRLAFSSIVTGDNPRVSMALYASRTDETLPFPVNLSGVNEIYHIVDHKRLLVFTDKGVSTVGAQNNDGGVTSSSINIGSANGYVADPFVRPVIAGNEVYFATSQVASIMRAQFEREINGYSFFESSFMSKDLFQRGVGINTTAYTRENYNTLWFFHRKVVPAPDTQILASDIVTGLTLRDGDNRSGAHQHDFGCVIHDSVTLSGKGRDTRMYMLTERTTRSGEKRMFIERVMNRELQNNLREDEPRFQYRFYDCFTEGIAPRFKGELNLPTVDLEQGNSILIDTTVAHGLTLTSGNFIRLSKEGVTWNAEITASTSTTVTVLSDDDCPFSGVVQDLELIALRNSVTIPGAYFDFDIGFSVDGIEVYNTVDDTVGAYSVPSAPGSYQLSADGLWFDYAIIGFNYISEVQSVQYVPPDNVPNVDVVKSLRSIDVEFEHTRDLLVSGYEPEDVTPQEMDKVGEFIYGMERDYYTGKFNIPVRGENNRVSRVLFRQIKPQPFTILGYEASIDM